MRLHRKRRPGRHKNKKRAMVLIIILIVLALLVVMDLRLRPVIRNYAQEIVSRLCYESINRAAADAIEKSGVRYEDIVKIERNADNCVTAVMADVSAVNKIKTGVTDELLTALESIEDESVRVPLGTITGSSLLAGRGPEIPVVVRLTGSSRVEVNSYFEDVGINQTRHSIVMEIHCVVYVVMLGSKSVSEVTLSVPIAETIIVGFVPETYLSFS